MKFRIYCLGILAVVCMFTTSPVLADPLYNAAKKGDIEQAKKLIDQGADINAKNNLGMTALMIGSISGHVNIVKLLLDRGANANAQDVLGLTALMEASDKGDTDIIKTLLDKSADINIKANIGTT